jgi:4-amino-4-deoxy-L-arabinose transferase-like glycosyltransferase
MEPSRLYPQTRRYLIAVCIILSGVLLKAALMGTGAVSFDSDEAVVALMGRHILAGERPIFFYGQTYMGSLDAFLAAIAFRLFGISVFSVRLVQLFLFVGLLLSTYRLARRLYRDETTAQISALLVALPPALMSLYTTVTLGGYAETLLFGTWILNLGHQITHEARDAWWPWALLGLIGGLALWTLPMAAVYLIPVALAILLQWQWRNASRYGLALLTFLLGFSPWWGYCLGHADACLKPFTDSPAELVVAAGGLPPLLHRMVSLLGLGIPALLGLRYPWSTQFLLTPLAVSVLAIYMGSVVYAVRVPNRARFLPVAMGATFLIIFLATPFGNDGTGRYLVSLYLLVALLAAELLCAVKRHSRWLAAAALACLLTFNLWGTLRAAAIEPAGLAAQLDSRLQYGNRHDDELIAFLQGRGERHGYGNYWLAFKLNFLSDEEIIIAPRLSYKADLSYNPADDRYPTYSRLVDSSPSPPFYITGNQPALDERLRRALDARQIDYSEQMIGDYRVFHGLSVSVTPEELELHVRTQDSAQ